MMGSRLHLAGSYKSRGRGAKNRSNLWSSQRRLSFLSVHKAFLSVLGPLAIGSRRPDKSINAPSPPLSLPPLLLLPIKFSRRLYKSPASRYCRNIVATQMDRLTSPTLRAQRVLGMFIRARIRSSGLQNQPCVGKNGRRPVEEISRNPNFPSYFPVSIRHFMFIFYVVPLSFPSLSPSLAFLLIILF